MFVMTSFPVCPSFPSRCVNHLGSYICRSIRRGGLTGKIRGVARLRKLPQTKYSRIVTFTNDRVKHYYGAAGCIAAAKGASGTQPVVFITKFPVRDVR